MELDPVACMYVSHYILNQPPQLFIELLPCVELGHRNLPKQV
jgi:hypothetical protein